MNAMKNHNEKLTMSQMREQGRIYSRMYQQTEGRVKEMETLVDAIDSENDPDRQQKYLIRLAVLGAYIKRRNNFLFIAEGNTEVDAAELMYCFRESLKCIELFDIPAGQCFGVEGKICFESLVWLYDTFEKVLEKALNTLKVIFISLNSQRDEVFMSLHVCTDSDMTVIENDRVSVIQEGENEWLVTAVTSRGGEEA